MIIVLLGYMGSGKSIVGQQLAAVLNYDFIDLDKYISEKERSTTTDIFKYKGEIYFRKTETKALQEILDSKNNIVLSLGGGTPCYFDNMRLIGSKDTVLSFYLKASISTLVSRLRKEYSKRPLIAHIKEEEQLTEFIAKHLFERSVFYSKAKYTIVADNKTIREVVEDIISALV